MRKLIIILTLAASWLAVSTTLVADPPPDLLTRLHRHGPLS